MNKLSFILLLSAYSLTSFADPFLLTEKLKSQGFKCVSQDNGDICTISSVNTKAFSYSQPIAILVPKNVRSPDKVLLHIHGFRGICESASASAVDMATNFNFLSQMKEANATNSVMVMPMSTGKETTFNASLVPQFSKFTDWVNAQVQPTSNRWVISGHSGAGSVIAAALSQNPKFSKRVDSVLLMDATYGNHTGQWSSLVDANPSVRIDSLYRGGTPTQAGSKALKSSLGARIQSTGERHCGIPGDQYGTMLARNNFSTTPTVQVKAAVPAVKVSSSLNSPSGTLVRAGSQ